MGWWQNLHGEGSCYAAVVSAVSDLNWAKRNKRRKKREEKMMLGKSEKAVI